MKKFYRNVDCMSRKAMTDFLKGHFRYYTMNIWNRSTSYACNMKIHSLDMPKDIEDKLYDMLDCQEVHDEIDCFIREFGEAHGWLWQAGFNGKRGGYLVMYHGGTKPSGHKSYCRLCWQRNYTSVEETGNVCGRCRMPGRVDFENPPVQVFTYSGKCTDMDEDFEGWSMDELRERVELVQEFDELADRIVNEVKCIAESRMVVEEIYYVPKTRKVLA